MSAPLPSQNEVKNLILSAIPDEEYASFAPHLERVSLRAGEVIYEPDEEIRYIYFPETSVISVMTTMKDGSRAEVGMVGPEGMVGIRVFLGSYTTPYRAVALIAGAALRVRAAALQDECAQCLTLQNLLLRYTAALLIQLRQLIACNSRHSLEGRFCRWLLMVSDRTGKAQFSFTQEGVSSKLGVRREGITLAANSLQKKGLISNKRGQIEITNRPGLQAEACECYQLIKDEYAHILNI